MMLCKKIYYGTKMEAIAYHNHAVCFNSMLHEDMTCDFIHVIFCLTKIPDEHLWNLAMEFVVTLHVRMEVSMSACRIQSTLCPSCFPQFDIIFSLRHNTTTGASSLTLPLQILYSIQLKVSF